MSNAGAGVHPQVVGCEPIVEVVTEAMRWRWAIVGSYDVGSDDDGIGKRALTMYGASRVGCVPSYR